MLGRGGGGGNARGVAVASSAAVHPHHHHAPTSIRQQQGHPQQQQPQPQYSSTPRGMVMDSHSFDYAHGGYQPSYHQGTGGGGGGGGGALTQTSRVSNGRANGPTGPLHGPESSPVIHDSHSPQLHPTSTSLNSVEMAINQSLPPGTTSGLVHAPQSTTRPVGGPGAHQHNTNHPPTSRYTVTSSPAPGPAPPTSTPSTYLRRGAPGPPGGQQQRQYIASSGGSVTKQQQSHDTRQYSMQQHPSQHGDRLDNSFVVDRDGRVVIGPSDMSHYNTNGHAVERQQGGGQQVQQPRHLQEDNIDYEYESPRLSQGRAQQQHHQQRQQQQQQQQQQHMLHQQQQQQQQQRQRQAQHQQLYHQHHQQPPSPPDAATDADYRTLFHSYILEYLQKHHMHATAHAFLRDASDTPIQAIRPGQVHPAATKGKGRELDSDIDPRTIPLASVPVVIAASPPSNTEDSSQRAMQCPPLLYEWFSIFWDTWQARTGGDPRAFVESAHVAAVESLPRGPTRNGPSAYPQPRNGDGVNGGPAAGNLRINTGSGLRQQQGQQPPSPSPNRTHSQYRLPQQPSDQHQNQQEFSENGAYRQQSAPSPHPTSQQLHQIQQQHQAMQQQQQQHHVQQQSPSVRMVTPQQQQQQVMRAQEAAHAAAAAQQHAQMTRSGVSGPSPMPRQSGVAHREPQSPALSQQQQAVSSPGQRQYIGQQQQNAQQMREPVNGMDQYHTSPYAQDLPPASPAKRVQVLQGSDYNSPAGPGTSSATLASSPYHGAGTPMTYVSPHAQGQHQQMVSDYRSPAQAPTPSQQQSLSAAIAESQQQHVARMSATTSAQNSTHPTPQLQHASASPAAGSVPISSATMPPPPARSASQANTPQTQTVLTPNGVSPAAMLMQQPLTPAGGGPSPNAGVSSVSSSKRRPGDNNAKDIRESKKARGGSGDSNASVQQMPTPTSSTSLVPTTPIELLSALTPTANGRPKSANGVEDNAYASPHLVNGKTGSEVDIAVSLSDGAADGFGSGDGDEDGDTTLPGTMTQEQMEAMFSVAFSASSDPINATDEPFDFDALFSGSTDFGDDVGLDQVGLSGDLMPLSMLSAGSTSSASGGLDDFDVTSFESPALDLKV